ncbi:hypothetical protein chiPu_0027126 [Chiloscyllium punctatum]|uniref:Uncharacterized protein n=1 Tax=Chiloscyllium punctatum TaxID=137246 RepID=A0A401TKC7_CHIPU|nr:hypothetical protein [Chiloscyllium punctatum]
MGSGTESDSDEPVPELEDLDTKQSVAQQVLLAATAQIDEGPISKSQKLRNEKKTWKAMTNPMLHQVTGITRVSVRKSKNTLSSQNHKSTTALCQVNYNAFAKLRLKVYLSELRVLLQGELVNKIQAPTQSLTVQEEREEEEVVETSVVVKDIELATSQTNVARGKAV